MGVFGDSEGADRGKDYTETIVKGILTETCPKLMKYTIPQFQKAQGTPVRSMQTCRALLCYFYLFFYILKIYFY